MDAVGFDEIGVCCSGGTAETSDVVGAQDDEPTAAPRPAPPARARGDGGGRGCVIVDHPEGADRTTPHPEGHEGPALLVGDVDLKENDIFREIKLPTKI